MILRIILKIGLISSRYPYNLEFNYQELTRFMKYSINNLGDPFDESNYGSILESLN